MEKRILLSFALSFGVLLLFYQFLYTPPPIVPAEVPVAATPAETVPAAGFGETSPAALATGGGEDPGIIQAEAAETVMVETDAYSVSISNEGALIRSLRLLDYRGATGEMLELLAREVDRAVGWPLELVTDDPETNAWLSTGLWVVERDGNTVSFELAGEGRRAFKELRFEDTGYYFTLAASVERGGLAVPFSVVWQGGFGDQSIDYAPAEVNVVYMEEGAFDRINVASIEDPQPLPLTRFLGIEDQYFLALFRSASPQLPVVRSLVPEGSEEELGVARLELPYGGELGVYVGPKQQDLLTAVDAELASVIDYGFFEIIARPLLRLLLWIQGYVGNFGWSIVLMTILINVALFPLRLKQQLSMLKMQKIQPQMRTLQDKYKKLKPNDPRRQEIQGEMMGLYKKNGVNPLGGCLPLLLQMPIFFAIFQLLRSATELRQAPWVLWIEDLSVYDPYYVLPVLMGVSMIATQRLTPTAMDPAQARLMMLMPVVFLIFMIRIQSGLVLYWLTSNLVGVAQQVLINRFIAPREQKKGAPPVPAESEPVAGTETAAIANPASPPGSRRESPKPKRRRKR